MSFANLDTWLDSKQKQAWPEEITYQRASASVSITAVVGASDGERMDSGGTLYSFTSTDFLVTASQLILNGEIVLPQRGDVIIWDSRRYAVLAQNSGEKPYRESGPGGAVLRVHTKKTGEAE